MVELGLELASEQDLICELTRKLRQTLPQNTDNKFTPISFVPKSDDLRKGIYAIYTAGVVVIRKEGIYEVHNKTLQILTSLGINYQIV